ncbi:MAG: hypothetical protein WCJ76_07000, partial [Comamonadaceae bacterium]
RWAHNPKVAGSNPARATNRYGADPVSKRQPSVGVLLFGPLLARQISLGLKLTIGYWPKMASTFPMMTIPLGRKRREFFHRHRGTKSLNVPGWLQNELS